MVRCKGKEHPPEREVQRGRAPPETLHGGLPDQKEKGEQRGSATVLCGGEKCATPHLDEEEIKELFLKAANILCTEKDWSIADFEAIKDTVFATAALESEKSGLQEEMNVVAELIQQCINENARVVLDQAEYQTRYNALADRFDKAKERLEAVSMEITEKQTRREMAEQCLAELAKQEGVVTEFDEDLWYSLVDHVTVHGKEDVRFTFKDGTEIKV